jgi:6-phosphogluconolactonase (cycloisomerase 2 family)
MANIAQPDNRFVMVSNRQDNSSTYQCCLDKSDKGETASDTLATFRPKYDKDDGSMQLELIQMYAAGGFKPRHFAFNKAGDFVAVALEGSDAVSVISRNIESGLLTGFVDQYKVASRPNMVLWDEP